MFVVKSEFNFKFCLVIIYGLNKIFVLCELLVVLILLFFFCYVVKLLFIISRIVS